MSARDRRRNSTANRVTKPRVRATLTRLFACVAVLFAVAGPIACSADSEKTETPVAQQREAVIQSFTMSFTLPGGVDFATMAVAASTSLNARDRSRVEGPMAVRQGPLTVDNDARTKALTAGGNITIRDRTVVTGNVRASGSVTRSPSSTVSGTVQANTNLGPQKTIQWTFQADTVSAGDVILVPDQERDLVPGSYGTLTVASRAKVRLHTGVYRFGRITVEPQGKLSIDSVNGPVQAYFTVGLTFRGAIETARFGAPQLLLGHQGTETVFVEAPFTGVLIAPNADVRVQAATPKGHDAVIYGKNVTLEPDTVVRPFPFNWGGVDGKLQPPFDPNRTQNSMPKSPADMPVSIDNTGAGATTTITNSPTPVGFDLPTSYPISGGEMCNSTVTFRFRQGTGPLVTCTYRGGSSTSNPSTEEELNKGRTLFFQSCSDGLPATARRQANHFELAVTPCAGFPAVVNAPVVNDGYCSEQLQLLTVEQTRQMRTSFDWRDHEHDDPLDEVNPDGTPALYYAWVLLKDKTDALALRQLYIHQLTRPLFQEELDQFSGKCGRLTNPGDGVGQFVPVVIPGKTYNKLIAALTDQSVQGNREIFDAVIIRQVPTPAARNPNGSINAQALVNSGFRYLDYDPNPFENHATMHLDEGAGATFINVLDFVAETALDGAELASQGLALLSRLLLTSVNVRVSVLADNPDTNFAPPGVPAPYMVRGWGQFAGQPLGALGLQVSIIQPALGVLPIPAMSMGNTDMVGTANISAIDFPTPAGICVELKNDGALVTDFILASQTCDFRGFTTSGHPLRNMSTDKDFINHSDDGAWMGMFQMSDAYDWDRLVAGFAPKRARVVTGFWANTIAGKDSDANKTPIPWTACLNFGNVVSEAMIAGAQAAGGLFVGVLPTSQPALGTAIAAFLTVLSNTDIIMGNNSTVTRKRVVMSHEYGHYTLCALLARENPLADDYLILSTLANREDTRQPFRYISEAFAEFIAGQVGGGADYRWLPDSVPGFDQTPQYCTAPASTPLRPICWDKNLRERVDVTTTRDNKGIGQIATLLMDAFDGHNARGTNVPTNGDIWAVPASRLPTDPLLTLNPSNYLDNDSGIERVHLTGPALFAFAQEYANLLSPLPQFDLSGALGLLSLMNPARAFRSVNHAMVSQGVNWCDRCRVLALHSTDLCTEPPPPIGMACTDDDPVDLIQHCMDNTFIRSALQEPPPNNGNFNFTTCDPCPSGQVANGIGGCGECPADVVLDGATIPVPNGTSVVSTSMQAPNDICPATFVVVINNPQAVFARPGGTQIKGVANPVNPITQANCQRSFQLSVARQTTSGVVAEPPITSTGVFSCPTPPGPNPPPCIATCGNVPTRTFLPGDISAGTSLRFAVPVNPGTQLNFVTGLIQP